MTIDPERFNEQFSILANSLQRALDLAKENAGRAALESFAATELYETIEHAVTAARALRPNGDGEQS
jgi:hypothetical protein